MRGFKIAFQEPEDYYVGVLHPVAYRAGSAILFWMPFALGTLSYTLTSFNWASVVTALENNKFLKFVRLPLVVFFYLLIPVFLVISGLTAYFTIPYFYIFSILLGVAGFFETIAFLYLGIKVLMVLRMISDQLRQNNKTFQEIKVRSQKFFYFSFLSSFLGSHRTVCGRFFFFFFSCSLRSL